METGRPLLELRVSRRVLGHYLRRLHRLSLFGHARQQLVLIAIMVRFLNPSAADPPVAPPAPGLSIGQTSRVTSSRQSASIV